MEMFFFFFFFFSYQRCIEGIFAFRATSQTWVWPFHLCSYRAVVLLVIHGLWFSGLNIVLQTSCILHMPTHLYVPPTHAPFLIASQPVVNASSTALWYEVLWRRFFSSWLSALCYLPTFQLDALVLIIIWVGKVTDLLLNFHHWTTLHTDDARSRDSCSCQALSRMSFVLEHKTCNEQDFIRVQNQQFLW